MPNIDTTNPIHLSILIGISLLLLIVIIVIIIKVRKNNKLDSQNEFAENLIQGLGGIDNIKEIKLSRRRLNAVVRDLNLLRPKDLRNLKLGAVITKNNVKMLVKDNPREIYKYINKKRKEGK